MSLLVTRKTMVLIKETVGGRMILYQSRSVLIPALNHGRTAIAGDSKESNQGLTDPDIPWPISRPLYGDGWKGYGRLVIPTYDMTTTWAIETSKKALVDTSTFSRSFLRFISTLDSNTAYHLFVKKSKESSDYLSAGMEKSKDLILDNALALTVKTKETVKSGKIKETVLKRLNSFWIKSKDLTDFIKQKIKNNDHLIEKVTSFSNKTKVYTISVLKNAKIQEEFYERSISLLEKSKNNSTVIYRKGKELSMMAVERSKDAGGLMMHRVTDTYSQAPSMILMIKNNKYVANFQDAMRRFETKPSEPGYTYVNRYFNRLHKQSITDVVRSNKMEPPSVANKHEYHSSALQLTKPMKLSIYDYPQLWIIEQPKAFSNVHVTREISGLIPEPLKKVWRGLRDKSLPSWQATIASILQKIQDSVVKKKK